MNEVKRQVLSVLVENTSGVLSQVSRLFSRKGYSIDSLTVGPTMDPDVSRMTIVINYNDSDTIQIASQLGKLLCVISVQILPEESTVRELVLVKVQAADRQARDEIMQLVNVFRARVVDVARESLTVEITGDSSKSNALLELLNDYGIIELARSGSVALQRGAAHMEA